MNAAPANLNLKRSLKYWDLILYGLAYIAPFAPLSTLGFVWNESNGLIVLAYLLGGVCMYFTARSYATMTEALPSAGSVYGFARHSLGAFPGFVAGWMILLDYLLIPAFVYVLIAVALETLLPGVDRAVWIILLIAVTTGVNWFGITVTSRANFISVAIQTAVLLGFAALCVSALYAGKGNGSLTLKPVFDARTFDAGRILSATSICVMSFLGFDAVSTLSEEVEGGDRRVVGRAIIAVLILAAVFFVGITWVLGNLLPGIRIKDPSAAVYELAAWATGPWTGPMPSSSGCRMRFPCRSGSPAWCSPWGATGNCPACWRAFTRAITRPTSACWSRPPSRSPSPCTWRTSSTISPRS
jgi:amino acid transporter